MASALLNNMSLALVASLPDITDGDDMSDEATQILFGVLDDLQKEQSPVCITGATHIFTLSVCLFFGRNVANLRAISRNKHGTSNAFVGFALKCVFCVFAHLFLLFNLPVVMSSLAPSKYLANDKRGRVNYLIFV